MSDRDALAAIHGHAATAGLVALCGVLLNAGVLDEASLPHVRETVLRDVERAPFPDAIKREALLDLTRAFAWSVC